MQQLHIREVMKLSQNQMLALPEVTALTFEDGNTLTVTNRSIVYSNIFWDLFRAYPKTKITKEHFVDSVLDNKPLTSNTHNKLIDNILASIVEEYKLHTPESMDHILGLIYDVVGKLQNELAKLTDEYVTSIDILDFINIVNHPVVKEATDNVPDNYNAINKCYGIVKDVLYKDESLEHNAVVVAVRAGMVNVNQVLQAVAVRGKLTEVDGSILPTGVLSNFTKGLTSLYEYVAESRSAAKSLYFSDSKLQDTEYAARRLQILTMVVEKLEYMDCGSTKYLNWTIQPPSYDEKGDMVYKGDLSFMEGKYYLNETSNQLNIIKPADQHLNGKTIKLRSSLFCKHPDPHAVCEVCFGTLAKNISRYSNLGHICVAFMTQQLTQSVLSTKHLDYSSSGSDIILNSSTSKYFTTNESKTEYILRSDLKDKHVKIVVNKEEASGLTILKEITNIEAISPIRMSAVSYIDVMTYENGQEIKNMLTIAQGNKRVIFTREFLWYAKEQGAKIDNKNNFVFDLSNWDFSKAIFLLPEREYSFSDHAARISELIESNTKNLRKRAKKGVAEGLIKDLFSLCNSKIVVNLSLLEVIVYACMIPEEDDYALSRYKQDGSLGIATTCIKNRSLSPAYAYKGINTTITSPRSFFKGRRPDNVFDVFICPDEYLKYRGSARDRNKQA